MEVSVLEKRILLSEEITHRKHIQSLHSIPLKMARICANDKCSVVHQYEECPNCGDRNFELLENFLPPSCTTWQQELSFLVRERNSSLQNQIVTPHSLESRKFTRFGKPFSRLLHSIQTRRKNYWNEFKKYCQKIFGRKTV